MRACCLQILPADPLAPPAAGVITYDALDLMWLDGLDDVRALAQKSLNVHTAQKAPSSFKCHSLTDLQWYCNWKGLSQDTHIFSQLPVVDTADLLQQIGVPWQQISSFSANLTPEMLSSLRQMVLPHFVQQAVELMADQLPELNLIRKLEDKVLFAG